MLDMVHRLTDEVSLCTMTHHLFFSSLIPSSLVACTPPACLCFYTSDVSSPQMKPMVMSVCVFLALLSCSFLLIQQKGLKLANYNTHSCKIAKVGRGQGRGRGRKSGNEQELGNFQKISKVTIRSGRKYNFKHDDKLEIISILCSST